MITDSGIQEDRHTSSKSRLSESKSRSLECPSPRVHEQNWSKSEYVNSSLHAELTGLKKIADFTSTRGVLLWEEEERTLVTSAIFISDQEICGLALKIKWQFPKASWQNRTVKSSSCKEDCCCNRLPSHAMPVIMVRVTWIFLLWCENYEILLVIGLYRSGSAEWRNLRGRKAAYGLSEMRAGKWQ